MKNILYILNTKKNCFLERVRESNKFTRRVVWLVISNTRETYIATSQKFAYKLSIIYTFMTVYFNANHISVL